MSNLVVMPISSPVFTDDVEAEQEIRPLFAAYQKLDGERREAGLELGRVLIKWHARYKSQGNRAGGGFEALLKKLDIGKKRAYRWMRKADPDYFRTPVTKSEPLKDWSAAVLQKMGVKGLHPAYLLLTTYFDRAAWEAAYKTARSNPDISGRKTWRCWISFGERLLESSAIMSRKPL